MTRVFDLSVSGWELTNSKIKEKKGHLKEGFLNLKGRHLTTPDLGCSLGRRPD